MIEKKNKKIIFIAMLLAMMPSYIYAWSGSIGYADTGSSGTESDGSKDEDYEYSLGQENGISYICKYDYEINVNYNITINGYDIENNEIMKNSLKISDEDKILAGTSMGLDIFETKNVNWKVTKVEVREKEKIPKTTYNCKYTCSATEISPGIYGCDMPSSYCSQHNIENKSDKCNDYAGCSTISTKKYWTQETEKESTNSTKIAECEKHAAKTAIEAAKGYVNSSYVLKLADSNDKNTANGETEINGNRSSCKNNKCTFDDYKKGVRSDSIEITYKYEPYKTCIDVKTAKIKYINNSESCNSNEMEIKKDSNHWHYFLPLNLNSKDEFTFQLQPSSGANLVAKQCQYVFENYSDMYTDLIVKRDDSSFVGDWKKLRENSQDYREINRNGCRLTSKIKIPIKQGFYKEITTNDNKISFNGFSFYYKPIDINNPFPNGIAEKSLWTEWDKESNKNPDLSKSFAKSTYTTKIDAKTIRNYTKDNPYTNWDNMNKTGVSQFIENTGMVERITDRNSFYKLGCGPYNKSWEECS